MRRRKIKKKDAGTHRITMTRLNTISRNNRDDWCHTDQGHNVYLCTWIRQMARECALAPAGSS